MLPPPAIMIRSTGFIIRRSWRKHRICSVASLVAAHRRFTFKTLAGRGGKWRRCGHPYRAAVHATRI